MIVSLKMFAGAKQLAGTGTLELELPAGASIGDLRAKLVEEVPALAPTAPHLMFAVGQQYVADDVTIPASADIACIPPVSGG